LTVASFAVSIALSIAGLIKNEKWARAPWLIPVIVAIGWQVLQDAGA
jgi:hypothetical protein